MNTTLRRRSLLEMMVCVVLVAALAVQPALGGDRKGKGGHQRGQQVTHKASKSGSGGTQRGASGASGARRTTRQVAATPDPAATAAPAPSESTPPAADPGTQPDPAVPAGTIAPEDGDSGTPPPAAAAPVAGAETTTPAAVTAPAADPAQRAPAAEAARPATPTPDTAIGTADREIVQPDAPVVPSQVVGPATATADAAAVAPPAATASAPVPNELPSTSTGRGTSARQPRADGGRAQARGRGTAPAGPGIDSTTSVTAPANALSEALRTPASAALVRVAVRPAGAAQTSRPQSEDNGIPSLQRPSRIVGVVNSVVEVIPTAMWVALGVLGALVLLLGAHTVLAAMRTRRLESQREKLMEDIGLLQAALLPAVPARMGSLLTTVAYRPADGPAAGGDFYDAFALPDGRVGLLLGDVSGHGRQALAKTTLVRFTVRAHLEAGMSPREAISIAGRSLDGRLADDFSTVLAAIHDPSKGTLTYASAGHPPPLVLGPAAHPPITASSAPPIGVGFPTGQRQTVLPMPEGTTVAVYSDGLLEARIDGVPLGSERLSEWLADLGPEATAKDLLDLVVQRADRVPDDLAAIVLHAAPGASAPAARVEQLKLDVLDIEGPDLDGFLQAAGISRSNRAIVGRKVSEQLAITGGVIVEVRTGEHATVAVSPIGGGAGATSRQTAPIR
jgi:hypothetical protein